MSSYAEEAESTTTLTSGWSTRSRSRQLRPSALSMPSSSATISGRRRSTRSRTWAPVWVAPTISMSSTDSSARRNPSNMRRLSSAISTRTGDTSVYPNVWSLPPSPPGRRARTLRQPRRRRNRPSAQIAFRSMNAPPRPRVVLAESDRPTRAGLRLVLEAGGLAVAGEAADAATAIAMFLKERPELGLVAAELPGGCIEAIRHVASEVPRTRLVVLTGRPSGEELVQAIRAGAVGYLARDTRSERLPEILRAVLAGEVALPRRHSQHLLEALRGRDGRRSELAARSDASLTDREWEVLELLADDISTSEIAQRLGITEVTTRRHISSLMAKLAVPDRASAANLLRRSS